MSVHGHPLLCCTRFDKDVRRQQGLMLQDGEKK